MSLILLSHIPYTRMNHSHIYWYRTVKSSFTYSVLLLILLRLDDVRVSGIFSEILRTSHFCEITEGFAPKLW